MTADQEQSIIEGVRREERTQRHVEELQRLGCPERLIGDALRVRADLLAEIERQTTCCVRCQRSIPAGTDTCEVCLRVMAWERVERVYAGRKRLWGRGIACAALTALSYAIWRLA